ncbi:hypothetical protein MKZ38_010593 [Zalerion maritima]|uniref:Uncharacterized protein n=1 Tax=Zalerion maritima TaxID=339359 RepID=A0AAD5WSD0_9PEZI|nr:hypothetical protein MKZ38_010593 [Zalerion maritima]
MLDLGVPIDVDKGAASFPTIPANNPGGGSGVKPASVRNTPTHNPCIHMNNFENLGSIGDRFQSGKLHGVAPAQILTELEARNGMEPVAGHAGKTQAVVMLNDRFLGNPPPHDHGASKNWFNGLLAGWDAAQMVLSNLLNALPWISPDIISSALQTLVNRDYIDKSLRVANVGIGDIEAMALELSMPLEGGS